MKSYCRKCAKRIRRGLACAFCGRPICYDCKCDCPRVLQLLADLDHALDTHAKRKAEGR